MTVCVCLQFKCVLFRSWFFFLSDWQTHAPCWPGGLSLHTDSQRLERMSRFLLCARSGPANYPGALTFPKPRRNNHPIINNLNALRSNAARANVGWLKWSRVFVCFCKAKLCKNKRLETNLVLQDTIVLFLPTEPWAQRRTVHGPHRHTLLSLWA